jgi:hypothetical protein
MKSAGAQGMGGEFQNDIEGHAVSAKSEFWNSIFVTKKWRGRRGGNGVKFA